MHVAIDTGTNQMYITMDEKWMIRRAAKNALTYISVILLCTCMLMHFCLCFFFLLQHKFDITTMLCVFDVKVTKPVFAYQKKYH